MERRRERRVRRDPLPRALGERGRARNPGRTGVARLPGRTPDSDHHRRGCAHDDVADHPVLRVAPKRVGHRP